MTLTRRDFGALALSPLAAAALPGWAQPVSQPMAMNLAPVTDWATQQPFLDIMKTARRWIGHLPGQWGGVEFDALAARGIFDAQGWPKEIPSDLGSIGTLVLTDLPEDADLAGRYVLRFDGSGIVEVAGRATNKRYGKGEISFDFTPGPGPVEIRIQRSDRRGTGDYIRNITVTRAEDRAAFEEGRVFRTGFLDMLRGCTALRFMDWMNTNDSRQGDWNARPKPTDFSYTRLGIPAEVMIDLANTLECDAWFNMPHLAEDTYLRAFAELVKAGLAPSRRVYVEQSNEVWNWQFEQTEWADAQAEARWGQEHRGAQFHGMRAAHVARIWAEIFNGADRTRLINVIATQTGWLGLERDILGAPLYVAENPAQNLPPHTVFDAYAVTGYFGHSLGTDRRADLMHDWLDQSRAKAEDEAVSMGLTGAALSDHVTAHQYDQAVMLAAAELRDGSVTGQAEDSIADLLGRVLPYHAGVAAEHDLQLLMYEGGTHVVGIGSQVEDIALTAFFTHLNYTPQMGALYDTLLAGWFDLTGGIFSHYADMQAPGKWGSWGALRYPGDTNPRWDAIARLL
ncbi:hypothetical protein [Roseovarius pelagicus]|uniref:Cellulose-binding protein n=1 Tax=Roseovarius pelagicus TaxID=2980108 RepID=A0ABY6DEX3_9RHOB|nr:hypothetical protein [Roseovarius pelagicus]UXX83518.1 hypothetical protein N7U68_02225 [Roseovarius pelagicus]